MPDCCRTFCTSRTAAQDGITARVHWTAGTDLINDHHLVSINGSTVVYRSRTASRYPCRCRQRLWNTYAAAEALSDAVHLNDHDGRVRTRHDLIACSVLPSPFMTPDDSGTVRVPDCTRGQCDRLKSTALVL